MWDEEISETPRWYERNTRTHKHKTAQLQSGFSFQKTHRHEFTIHHFSLSLKPNPTTIENKTIPPFTFRFMLSQCTNPEF